MLRKRSYVSRSRRQTDHGFHAFMTLMTCSLWLPVWLSVWLWNRFGPRKRSRIVLFEIRQP